MGAGPSATVEHGLTLNRAALSKWRAWTAPAQAYLPAKEPQFDLGPLITSNVGRSKPVARLRFAYAVI